MFPGEVFIGWFEGTAPVLWHGRTVGQVTPVAAANATSATLHSATRGGAASGRRLAQQAAGSSALTFTFVRQLAPSGAAELDLTGGLANIIW